MMVEGVIRFGSNAQGNKQGMWPAFWMLGESIHHGTPWPQCGELDIMERVNGGFSGFRDRPLVVSIPRRTVASSSQGSVGERMACPRMMASIRRRSRSNT